MPSSISTTSRTSSRRRLISESRFSRVGDELATDRRARRRSRPPSALRTRGPLDPDAPVGEHTEPDTDAQRQQSLLPRDHQLAERLLHARRQREPADRLARGDLLPRYGLHGASSSLSIDEFSIDDFALATVATRPDKAGGPSPQVLRAIGQPLEEDHFPGVCSADLDANGKRRSTQRGSANETTTRDCGFCCRARGCRSERCTRW